jgi:amino acid adenylation domain-containing protein
MKLSNFNLLDENSEDKDFLQFIESFNATHAAYPVTKSVADLFNEQVLLYGNEIALFFKNEEITYNQLNEKAEKIAAYLQQNRIGKEDIVALLFDKSPEMIYAILGVVKSGAVYLPLDPTHPEDRLNFVLEDSGAKIILSHSDFNLKLANLSLKNILCIDSELPKLSFSAVSIHPDDTLYIIYTSGSTGRPKGCKISHRNVVRLMKNEKHDFAFSNTDVWIMAHAYYFDFSVWEMYGAFLYGGKLVIPFADEVKDVNKLHALVCKHGVSVLNQTPLAFNFFMEEEFNKNIHELNKHLRYVIFGGDKLDPSKLKKWTEFYPLNQIKMINMYGITETTVHVTYYEITENDVNTPGVSPIGRPLPETKIYLLNENLQHVPVGVVGEMYVGGTGVCKGYLNREELTQERFVKNPFNANETLYKTGDQARWTSDKKLDYLGRIDFQVKIRGYRIELGEIESVLNSCKGVKQGVVIAVDNKGESQLAAYLVSDNSFNTEELRAEMQSKLPEYMIPAYFVEIESIPLTSNGKLDKKSLPNPFKNAISNPANYVAPQTQEEEIIVKIWQEQLGVEQIGVEDNFFHIGGDSLKAIRVVVQMNKHLGVTIRIADIFTHKTIRNIVANLSEIGKEAKNDFEIGLNKIEQIKNFILANNKEEIPNNYEDIYPLTTIEKGMIFSSLLRPEEPVYYDQFTYNLVIKSKEVFFKAFELMVKKHPILRSKYFMNTFLEPVKVQMNSVELPIQFENISDKSRQEQQKVINQYLLADSKARLQFENDLLWHLKAFQINDNRFYLVWTVHHAMLDGWSENSFVAEFANLCSDNSILTIDALSELKSSFKDYTAIQLGRETSGNAVQFWKEHLNGFTRNKLPFNLSGKRISAELGMKKIQRSFNSETSKAIEQIREKYAITPKTICLAAYAYLMHIICSEKDVVAGVVSNDRPEMEDADKILGCFLNTVPFRIDFEKVKTYKELLTYFSDYLNKIRQHEIYLVDIANAVGEKSSGNPLFDCIFNYTDFYVLENISQSNENLRYTDKENQGFELLQNNLMTNTLFDVEIDRTLGEYSIGIKYAPAFFRAEDVSYTIELYENILKAFAKNAENKLNVADLLDTRERNWLLYEFNNTIVPYAENKLMHQLFEEKVIQNPNQAALSQHGKTITYKELNDKSNQLAHYLVQKGIKSGAAIGIICERNFELVVGLLAILKSAASYVPVDPSYPKDRQEYILNNSVCELILTDSDYEIDDKSGKFINIRHLDLSPFSSQNLVINKSSKDLAYTIYTSGSTGRPKGVMIAHHSAVNLIEWVNKEFKVSTADRLLFITSICFDLSVYDVFGMLAAGGTIVIATQDEVRDPETLKKIMKEEKITFWDAVPTTMNYLVDMIETSEPDYIQNDLRLVFMSGDWIPVTLPDKINKYFPNAKNISLGGATEGTVWSNFYPIEKVEPNQISIPYGKPMDNNFFYILDDNQQPVPRGVAGELYIGGVGVALGYANDKEKTDAAFFADPFSKLPDDRMYKTGDLGRMMPEGSMEFLGRKDFQVKIRGFRVELGEIENQLQKHETVQRAIVLAKEDANNSKYLCAYVVLKEAVDNDNLKQHLAKDLPDYMIPGIFIRIDKVPVTANGKIDRKALPDPSDFIQEKEIKLPTSEMEKELTEIWKTILGHEKIGVNENVFELGAHSLHAGAFVSRVHKKLNLTIALRDLFANPTIEQQAKIIEKNSIKKQFTSISKLPLAENYEVSHAQRRLWIIDQIQEGKSTEYNLPIVFALKGEFSIEQFEKAIQSVVDKHEILRTSFKLVNNELRQFVKIKHVFKAEVFNTSNQTEINEIIANNAYSAFDLSIAPLFRVAVIQKNNNDFIVSFVMHHIISDGWSMGVLVRDIFQYYSLHGKNQSVEMEELPVQYKDFSTWQNKQLADDSTVNHKNYWLEKMSGDLPLLDLPTKISRPVNLNNKAKSVYNKLSKEKTLRVKEYCAANQVSTFMLLQAAVKALFYRYTGQKDIIIGSPIAGREHADLANQIGFYVNTLALRDQIEPTNTFSHLLQQVKETILGAFEHQVYPYDKLVDDLGIPRNLNRNPLFDIMLVMQNVDENKSFDKSFINEINKTLQLEKLENDELLSKFDITFNFFESEELMLNLEYRSELYEDYFIQNIWNHLENILENVLKNPSVKIKDLAVLGKEEKAILTSFNQIALEYPSQKTVYQLVEKQIIKSLTIEALVFENGSWTYQELLRKANDIASHLQNQRIKEGDVVAVYLPKTPHIVSIMLGIWKVGAVYLPLNVSYPKERIEFMLSDSAAKHIFTFNETFGISASNPEQIESSANQIESKGNGESVAYIIYTSGSTGKPKGVLTRHKNASNFAIGLNKAFKVSEKTRIIMFASIAFDASIGEILPTLYHSATIVIPTEEILQDTEKLYSFMVKHKVSTALFMTSFFHLLDENKMPTFKSVMTGGEKVIFKDIKRFSEKMDVYHVYGPTETTVYASVHKFNPSSTNVNVPIGKPLPNYSLYVVDENGNLQPIGVNGELWIGGESVAKGYLHNEQLTNDKFINNPFGDGKLYKSGDLVRWNIKGEIEYINRIDNQIKIRGFRVELGEIENAICKTEGVNQVFVTDKGTNADKYLVAYVVHSETLDASQIKNKITGFLPDFMIPTYFVSLKQMPLTVNGKIDKNKLPDITSLNQTEILLPENELEEQLLNIWKAVLGKTNFGVTDRFFELGGNSLKAIQVINRVREELYIELSVKDLFGKDTIKLLADTVLEKQLADLDDDELLGMLE